MERYRSVMTDSARWEGFEFRPDDIVISTPPKCGTTWMQMMCALLIFGGPDLGAPLTELSPWMDILTERQDAVWTTLENQRHRRFIKSHTPLDGIPWSDDVTYITVGRDPRDVAVSWANHFDNMDLERTFAARVAAVGADDLAELMAAGPPPDREASPVERFWRWMEDDSAEAAALTGLRGTLHHLDTFWQARDRPNVVLFHYADMTVDLEPEMRRLSAVLGIPVSEEQWPELVGAAHFDSMRGRADHLAPQVKVDGFWKDASRFFNRGGIGQWRDVVQPWDEDRYRRRVSALVAPDLDRWVHQGGAAASTP